MSCFSIRATNWSIFLPNWDLLVRSTCYSPIIAYEFRLRVEINLCCSSGMIKETALFNDTLVPWAQFDHWYEQKTNSSPSKIAKINSNCWYSSNVMNDPYVILKLVCHLVIHPIEPLSLVWYSLTNELFRDNDAIIIDLKNMWSNSLRESVPSYFHVSPAESMKIILDAMVLETEFRIHKKIILLQRIHCILEIFFGQFFYYASTNLFILGT